MQPLTANSLLLHVPRQILRQTLRQSRHQHPVTHRRTLPDLLQQMRHLPASRDHVNLRIHQARRTNHLLHHLTVRLIQLPVARSRRDQHPIRRLRIPLVKLQRTVVLRHRQPKSMVHQSRLASMIAGIHRPNLRHRHMRLVHKQQKILREKVVQRVRRFPRLPTRQGPTVVLDPRTKTRLLHQLKVVSSPGGQPLRLQQLPLLLKHLQCRIQLLPYLIQRRINPTLRQHKMLRRINVDLTQRLRFPTRNRINHAQLFNLIAPQLHPIRKLLVRRPDLNHITTHTKLAPRRVKIVPVILNVHQPQQQTVPVHLLPHMQRYHHRQIVLR